MSEKLNALRMRVRQQMEHTVLLAAEELPELKFSADYADGTWGVECLPNGTVINSGYAKEMHGQYRNICSLANWELGKLLDALSRN